MSLSMTFAKSTKRIRFANAHSTKEKKMLKKARIAIAAAAAEVDEAEEGLEENEEVRKP